MSELSHYYENVARSGAWMDPDATQCGCRGKGWWLSEVDTWHSCGYHYTNQPHPEEGEDYVEPVQAEALAWVPCDGEDIPF